jgi:hypothetical protein
MHTEHSNEIFSFHIFIEKSKEHAMYAPKNKQGKDLKLLTTRFNKTRGK